MHSTKEYLVYELRGYRSGEKSDCATTERETKRSLSLSAVESAEIRKRVRKEQEVFFSKICNANEEKRGAFQP